MTPSIELGIGKRALAWAKSVFAFGKRIATLEARVSALEAALEKHSPDVCDFCGERGMRKTSAYAGPAPGGKTMSRSEWTCGKCGRSEPRIEIL
jgi:hypothetical protein